MTATGKPLSPDHARALAMAYELQNLLHSLAERRDVPRVDAALDLLDGVLDELDGPSPDQGKETAHSLRLLVTAPREYNQERTGHALRSLATRRWRP